MAIEGLFYGLLAHYREELPDDIVKSWQPRQIIDAIAACNPFAESYQEVRIGPSRNDPTDKPLFVGQYKPVSRKLLRQYYHGLGSYLHAAVDGAPLNEAKLRATVSGTLDRVEEYCRETTVIANLGMFVSVPCGCGRTIKCNITSFTVRRHTQCPDPACGAIYDLVGMAPVMQTAWTLRTARFRCENCEHDTAVGVHLIRAGHHVICTNCKTEFVLRQVLIGEAIQAKATSEQIPTDESREFVNAAPEAAAPDSVEPK
jgi:hypothetical protein